MAKFMDVHDGFVGVTQDQLDAAHEADLKIEGEPMVVDLLDYDVRFGQGMLFSAPRPVRADALGPERHPRDEPAKERPPAA